MAAAAASRPARARRARRSSAVMASDWAEVVSTAVQEAQSSATVSDSRAASESKAGDEGGFSSFEHLVRSANWDEDRVVQASRSIAALRGIAGMPRARVDMVTVIARQTVQGLLALRLDAHNAHQQLQDDLASEQERANLERQRADDLDSERLRLLAVIAAQDDAARAAAAREAAQTVTITRLEDLIRALRSGEPRVTNRAMQRAVHAATTLQRLWRGYWCRHRYKRVLRRLVFGEVSLPPLRGLGGGLRAARTDVVGAMMMQSPSSKDGNATRSWKHPKTLPVALRSGTFGVDNIMTADKQTSDDLEAAANGEWAILQPNYPPNAAIMDDDNDTSGDGGSDGSWARASTVIGTSHPPSPLRLGTEKHSRAQRAAEMLRLPPPKAVRGKNYRRTHRRHQDRAWGEAIPLGVQGRYRAQDKHERAGVLDSPARSDGAFAALRETASSLIPQPTPLKLPPQRRGVHAGVTNKSSSRSMSHGEAIGSQKHVAVMQTPPRRPSGGSGSRRGSGTSSRARRARISAGSSRGSRRAARRDDSIADDDDSDGSAWVRHPHRRPVLSGGSDSPDRQLTYDGAITGGNQSSVGGLGSPNPSLGSPDSFAILARMGHGSGPNPDDLGSVHGMGHQQGRF